jgi:hypothetical protein
MAEDLPDGRFELMSTALIEPYGACVRSRLVSNTLLFAAQCWGHLALIDVPAAPLPDTPPSSMLDHYAPDGESTGGIYTYIEEEFGRVTPPLRRIETYGEQPPTCAA